MIEMGKYIVVVAIVIITAILAGLFPYAQNNNVNEQPLVAVIDTFYSVDINSNEAAFCYLGDSTFFIRTLSHVILIDPSDKIRSKDIYAIKKLDILLITLKDGDHFEPETTCNIYQKTNSTIITNQEVYSELEGYIPSDRLREIQPGQKLTISSITITAISSDHYGNETLTFLISMDEINVFYGANLSYDDEFSKFLPNLSNYANTADIAIVPTNGILTASASQYALDMIKTLGPRIVITSQSSPDEQNTLKNLIDEELLGVSVVIPEKLWVYEIVVK